MTAKTRIKSRPATAGDIEAFFGRTVPHTIRARALERDGVVVGVAGYYIINGLAVVFSDSKGGISKMTIWRESKAMMDGMKIPAICVSQDGSGPFLERLGWQYVGPSADGEVYKWL